MGEKNSPLQLKALELTGTGVRVHYASGKQEGMVHEPGLIRVGPQELFVEWPDSPSNLKKVLVEWKDSPFAPNFKRDCTVVNRDPKGITFEFDHAVPLLQDWLAGFSSGLDRRESDAALKTSRLYTGATVVSACGLLCGALAILLPILVTDRTWVDSLAKALLILMVVSIGGFAWIRILAGKAEIRALKNSRG